MITFKEFLTEQFGELNESSLSRLWSKAEKYTCGAITGFRGENTKETNKANNKEILAVLKEKGFSVTTVKGSYIENFGKEGEKEVGETSFFVCNEKVEGDDKGELRSVLVALGKKYDQDSVLIVPFKKPAYLFGTSKRDNAFPEYGKKEEVGNPKFGSASGPFFSRVKGRKFAFEEVEEPSTINGRWARHLTAKRIDMELNEAPNQKKDDFDRHVANLRSKYGGMKTPKPNDTWESDEGKVKIKRMWGNDVQYYDENGKEDSMNQFQFHQLFTRVG